MRGELTQSNSKFVGLMILLVFLLPLVFSCTSKPVELIESITGITATPITPSPSPTPSRVCPNNIELLKSDVLTTQRSLVVVLFDEKSILKGYPLTFMDGRTTVDVFDFLGNVLPKALAANDEYAFFSLGYRDYDAAKIERYVSSVEVPNEIRATPIPPVTLTPISTPTQSNVVIENKKGTQLYATEVALQQATQTQSVFEYWCIMSVYDKEFKATATAWAVTKDEETFSMMTQIANIRTPKPVGSSVKTATPFPGNNLYEGLSHVTVDFSSRCPNYERCILIIIDELADWRNTSTDSEVPTNLNILLDNVEVIAVMPQCEDSISPSCTEVQDLWTDKFINYFNASSVVYGNSEGSTDEESLELYLIDQLGGN